MRFKSPSRLRQSALQATTESCIAAAQDWLGGMSFLDFLRDVGRFSRVNVMLSRDSVKSRLGREEGISFTE